MYVQVVLSLVSMIAVFLTRDALRRSIEQGRPELTEAQVDTSVTVALAIGVVFGLLFSIAWLVLARFVATGANWARIVTWVVAGISLLSTAVLIGQPTINIVLGALGALIDIVVIVLLARAPSSKYFLARWR